MKIPDAVLITVAWGEPLAQARVGLRPCWVKSMWRVKSEGERQDVDGGCYQPGFNLWPCAW